jgi:hypothetical protein
MSNGKIEMQNVKCKMADASAWKLRDNPVSQIPNTIVVRPFKVMRSCPGTRLKPRTTFLRFGLSF